MITLNSCPENEYFEVKELWFYYDESLKVASLGLTEGCTVLVKNKTERNVLIETNISDVLLTKEEALNVNGDIKVKKYKKGTTRR